MCMLEFMSTLLREQRNILMEHCSFMNLPHTLDEVKTPGDTTLFAFK